MGWKRGRSYGNGNGEWEQPKEVPWHRKDWDGTPNFSTRIDHAWLVVDHMRANGWQFALALYNDKLPYASFCKGSAQAHHAEKESVPEAICLAALFAVKP